MKLFERRKPPRWSWVIIATLLGALAIYAVCSGDALTVGRRGEPPRHILRDVHPDQFLHHVRFYFSGAGLLYFLGLIRLVPVENGFHRLRTRSRKVIRQKGYDKNAAPWWVI